MYNRNQVIFTRLELKDQDALPQETLRESYMLTCHNWLFTLRWAKEFNSKIRFFK